MWFIEWNVIGQDEFEASLSRMKSCLLVYLCVRWEEALVSFLFLGNNIFLCPRSNESGSFSRCERVGKTAKKMEDRERKGDREAE